MKKFARIFSFLLVAMMLCAVAIPASAADSGTITIYKMDLTQLGKDGHADINSAANALGSVDAAYAAYGISGVEYTYVKVSTVATVTVDNTKEDLYAIEPELAAILELGNADVIAIEGGVNYYRLLTIYDKLRGITTVDEKDALEAYAVTNGTAFDLTSDSGATSATGLAMGLYLIVETKVPENVYETSAPFFMLLSPDNASQVAVPKNVTDMPTLEKTVRESLDSTGRTEDYDDYATASEGDIVEYQIVSTLPTITSKATYLTTYTFVDEICDGISYAKNDVVIKIFSRADLSGNALDTWTQNDAAPKFNVTYEGNNKMTIAITAAGLEAINANYANKTIQITYAATVDSNSETVLGDAGNANDVTLTWKRTNTVEFDTLTDDAHVYTFGIQIQKSFADNNGDYSAVKFIIKNASDEYYLVATGSNGIYYVTGTTTDKSQATEFSPVAVSGKNYGTIDIKGVEDDTYTLEETATDANHVLMSSTQNVVITVTATAEANSGTDLSGAYLPTATATAGEITREMIADGESTSATAPIALVNNVKIEIPDTGDIGTWILTCVGMSAATVAVCVLINLRRKKNSTKA